MGLAVALLFVLTSMTMIRPCPLLEEEENKDFTSLIYDLYSRFTVHTHEANVSVICPRAKYWVRD